MTGELDERAVGQVLLGAGEGERVLRTLLRHVDEHDLSSAELSEEDLLGEGVLDVPLERPAQRPCPQDRVEATLGDEGLGGLLGWSKEFNNYHVILVRLDLFLHRTNGRACSIR